MFTNVSVNGVINESISDNDAPTIVRPSVRVVIAESTVAVTKPPTTYVPAPIPIALKKPPRISVNDVALSTPCFASLIAVAIFPAVNIPTSHINLSKSEEICPIKSFAVCILFSSLEVSNDIIAATIPANDDTAIVIAVHLITPATESISCDNENKFFTVFNNNIIPRIIAIYCVIGISNIEPIESINVFIPLKKPLSSSKLLPPESPIIPSTIWSRSKPSLAASSEASAIAPLNPENRESNHVLDSLISVPNAAPINLGIVFKKNSLRLSPIFVRAALSSGCSFPYASSTVSPIFFSPVRASIIIVAMSPIKFKASAIPFKITGPIFAKPSRIALPISEKNVQKFVSPASSATSLSYLCKSARACFLSHALLKSITGGSIRIEESLFFLLNQPVNVFFKVSKKPCTAFPISVVASVPVNTAFNPSKI